MDGGTSVACHGSVPMRRIRVPLYVRYAILLVSLLCTPHAANAQQTVDSQVGSQPGPEPDAKQSPEPDTKQSQEADHEASGKAGSRIFGVMPNYTTVEGATEIQPISTARKFHLAELNSFDPYVFPFVGVIAAVGQGEGSSGYPRRYAMALTDNSIGNFMTTAVLPSALRQDPRYFEMGQGGFWRRAGYALSRSVIARRDAGGSQFNVSEIGGNLVAAGLSNLYYPAASRSVANTLTRWGTQVMWDTLANELKEFWPDFHRKIRRGP
jgi:hypothetical protein